MSRADNGFEDAWRVVKYELTPSSQRYAREEVGPGPTTLTAVEARTASVDPCCEEARGKLLHAITGTPYDPENGFEGHGEWEPNMEDLTCDELRNWWDAEVDRLKREEYGPGNEGMAPASFIEELAEIMLEWDECDRGEHEDFAGMANDIEASRDAFSDAWDVVKAHPPLDILNDPLVHPAGYYGAPLPTVDCLDPDFRKWLYAGGWPTDDDFAQMPFEQKVQVLLVYRMEGWEKGEEEFAEDNV